MWTLVNKIDPDIEAWNRGTDLRGDGGEGGDYPPKEPISA